MRSTDPTVTCDPNWPDLDDLPIGTPPGRRLHPEVLHCEIKYPNLSYNAKNALTPLGRSYSLSPTLRKRCDLPVETGLGDSSQHFFQVGGLI